MKVFAVFSGKKAGMVKIWARSWAAHGWTPRLLSEKEVRLAGTPRAAARARGGGLLADLGVINFGYPVRNRPRRRVIRWASTGWTDALLVRFPEGTTEERILECGRRIWG